MDDDEVEDESSDDENSELSPEERAELVELLGRAKQLSELQAQRKAELKATMPAHLLPEHADDKFVLGCAACIARAELNLIGDFVHATVDEPLKQRGYTFAPPDKWAMLEAHGWVYQPVTLDQDPTAFASEPERPHIDYVCPHVARPTST